MAWLAENGWLVWLIIAGLLAVAETQTGDFTLLMLAGGALIGVLVAVLLPALVWVQVAAALVVAVGLLFLLRPTLLKRIRDMPGYRSSLDKIVGSTGLATSEITTSSGAAKIAGEAWTARAVEGVIPPGTEIEVYRIDGAVAVVYPRRETLP